MEAAMIAGRKKFRLRESNLLRRNAEKRHSFTFEATLSQGDDTMNGYPEFIQNAYKTMLKAANLQKQIKTEARFENVAIEIFPTPKGRRVFSVIMGATMTDFALNRVGKGDDADVVLTFKAIFPGRKDVHDWVWDHAKAEFYAQFEEQQGEMFEGEEDESDEAEAEEDAEDE